MIDTHHLCPGCMAPWPDPGTPCPHCGFCWQQPAAPARALPPFTILGGRYLLGTPLGAGGFGVTYLAMDLVQEQRVAVKEFFPQTLAQRDGRQIRPLPGEDGRAFRDALRSFRRESELMARFRDVSGIVSWRDFLEENDTAYLVMDYLPGETLIRHMRRTGTTYPQQEALALMRPILLAVDAMHHQQVLHRDISPENLILDPAGKLTLIDFGAAREFDLESDENLTVVLKRGYAPEEQYRSGSRQGPWTDLYACCAVLYQMVSGIRPQDADRRRQKDELAPLDEIEGVEVTHGFALAVEKGLTVHATERYPSIRALLDDLEPAAPPSGTPGAPPEPTPSNAPPQAEKTPPPPPPGRQAQPGAPPANRPKYLPEGKGGRSVVPVAVLVLGLALLYAVFLGRNDWWLLSELLFTQEASPTPTPAAAFDAGPLEGWTAELNSELLDLMGRHSLVADSLTEPQEYDSAEAVMTALETGMIDCVVGAEVHDPAGPQEEGYYVVAPPAAWQMEDWGFYTILTADPGVYWKITMILLDEGYYDSDDIWYAFLIDLRDNMENSLYNPVYEAPDEPTAELMEPYLDYWSQESGSEYTLYRLDDGGEPSASPEPEPTGAAVSMPDLITVTGTIPAGDEDLSTSMLYHYSVEEGYLGNGFTGGIFFDDPVTVDHGGTPVVLDKAVLMTGIIPPAPYQDVEVLRFDDFEPGGRYEIQGFWMDPADYYGQGAWVDDNLFGPTHTNDAGDWYEVYVYASGNCLFVPVSAAQLD